MGNRPSYPLVDLSGKVAIVTGANTGIGYETAKTLAEMGAHTFIACRSQERAAAAIDRMKQEVGEGKELKVEYLLVDLASFSSVKDFVKTFREKNLPLDILINNAAICGVPFTKTSDGFDLQFQVNHLGPVLLTLELLPSVIQAARATGDGRIIFVSSEAHRFVKWEPEMFSPVSEEGYGRFKMYGWTKLYNIMSAHVLQRKLKTEAVTLLSLHPGYIQTDLKRGFQDRKFLTFLNNLGQVAVAKSREQGAATSIYCAVDPSLNCKQAFFYSDCARKDSNDDSRNERYQDEMWSKTTDLLKEHLSICDQSIATEYGISPELLAAVLTQDGLPVIQPQHQETEDGIQDDGAQNGPGPDAERGDIESATIRELNTGTDPGVLTKEEDGAESTDVPASEST